jgi:hypothetical protein
MQMQVTLCATIVNLDGTTGNAILVDERLDVELDEARRRYRIGKSADGIFGYGHTQEEALLNYLRVHLDVDAQSGVVGYSKRIY